MEKATGSGVCGPEGWVGWGLRESPGGVKGVSQVDGDSDVVSTPYLHRRDLAKEQQPMPVLLSGTKLAGSPPSQTIQLLPVPPWCLLRHSLSTGAQRVSAGKVLCTCQEEAGISEPLVPLSHSPHWFSQPEAMRI